MPIFATVYLLYLISVGAENSRGDVPRGSKAGMDELPYHPCRFSAFQMHETSFGIAGKPPRYSQIA